MSKRILLGVIAADCHISFQAEILRGIISQSFRSNCDIAIFAPLHNFSLTSLHKDTEKQIFELLFSDRTDGLIYDRNTIQNDDMRAYIDELCRNSGKPVMLLDFSDHKNFETTSVDDCDAFETITDHLIEVHGKRKIYCLTGPKKTYSAEQRLSGYKRSMKKHGITIGKEWAIYGDFWHNAANELARRIISGELERPEAVVCGNDVSAIILCNALIEGGIRVPEDIAVTGYDASPEAKQNSPSITSYSRPNFQLGAEAVRRLYRIITGKICGKVRNEYGGLSFGQSCGCRRSTDIRKKESRSDIINNRYENYFLYGDMLFDITNTGNIQDFADRLDNYTYFLHKMKKLRICLTDSFIRSTSSTSADNAAVNLGFGVDSAMHVVLAKSSIGREYGMDGSFPASDVLPDFTGDKKYPSAYYISPLHYNDNFFGYSALSFGKEPMTFSPIYYQWINYVNVALEQMRIRAILNNTVLSAGKALMHDDVTGMPNRNGICSIFREKLAQSPSRSLTVECIAAELHGLKKAYYQDGEEKSNRITNSFAAILKKCAAPGEIVGVWSPQMFCIISFGKERTEKVYEDICSLIRRSDNEERRSLPADFSIGTYTQTISSFDELSGCVYQASINRVYTYTTSDSNSNPQFDKLCQLRGKMRKHPEEQWNISTIADSLYLSKSYLQKIYKTYFNKSIIEELIEFRLEKAKELLTETNMTITDISHECGYSSYNYFVRQFRHSEGVSPTEYRNSKESEKNEG